MAARGAAKQLLTHLLESSSAVVGDSLVTVSLLKHYTCSWPRPQSEVCCKQVQLSYSKGLLGIAELQHLAVGSARVAIASEWMSALFPLGVGSDSVIHVVDLFKGCCNRKCLQPLFAQVLLGICKGIDKICGQDSHIRKRGSDGCRFSFQWLDGFHTDGDSKSVAPIIAQYVHNGVQVHGTYLVYSISTDKAWVNGLPLQNSIVGNPDNFVSLSTPQACFFSFTTFPMLCFKCWWRFCCLFS